MQTTDSTDTLASVVYRRLHNDILTGQIKPGQKLQTQELRETYGVGNSPIREALNRLSSNGMVVRAEHRGFRVASASTEELLEIINTRCALEELALRESIANGDEDWEERVLLSHHRLSRAPRPEGVSPLGSSEEWETRHREFHLALLSACTSSILIGYCSELQARQFRYRNLSSVRAYRGGLATDDHMAIKEAALARDADTAVKLLSAHYRATGNVVSASADLDK